MSKLEINSLSINNSVIKSIDMTCDELSSAITLAASLDVPPTVAAKNQTILNNMSSVKQELLKANEWLQQRLKEFGDVETEFTTNMNKKKLSDVPARVNLIKK